MTRKIIRHLYRNHLHFQPLPSIINQWDAEYSELTREHSRTLDCSTLLPVVRYIYIYIYLGPCYTTIICHIRQLSQHVQMLLECLWIMWQRWNSGLVYSTFNSFFLTSSIWSQSLTILACASMSPNKSTYFVWMSLDWNFLLVFKKTQDFR